MGSPFSFFAKSDTGDRHRARLLLLSYHFPPSQAAGALRWQKFARFAADRGWSMDVVTLDPTSLHDPDPDRLEDLPGGIRVFGVPTRSHSVERLEHQLHGLRRKLQPQRAPRAAVSMAREEMVVSRPASARFWIRLYDAWLEDARGLDWALRAAALGRELIEPGVHRALISCGPPHMPHEGARRLATQTRLPWVIDMRDPWSLVERVPESLASPLRLRKAAALEMRAVKCAGLVVMNTEPACRAMRELYPQLTERITTVMNGFDDDDELPRPETDSRFLIAYAGSVYLDRNPRAVFQAAARLVRELDLAPSDLGIEFMGYAEGVDLEAMAAEEGLAGFVRQHPRGTRREAAEFLARAALLLNLPQDSRLAIPSKIFEYMRYEAWLLALEERGSATEMVLRETEADVATPDDIHGIAEVLRRRYTAFVAGDRPKAVALDESLSRRTQARHLFDSIERIAGPPTR